MTKAQCIESWLNLNFPSGKFRAVAAKLVGKRSGRLAIANAMVIPFTKRIYYLKAKLELGKEQLGYQSCITEVANEIESLLNDLECALSIFYKREYSLPIKTISEILEETKQFSLTFKQRMIDHGYEG